MTVEGGSGRLLLITGSPGAGKTTVIRKVADSLSGRKLGGFYTEEIRVRGERQGFRLVTFDGHEGVMAHVDHRGPHRVGKYGVNVPVIDELSESALAVSEGTDLYLVDEIGKMECMSRRFIAAMRELLGSRKPIVATIAGRGGCFIEEVKRREGALLITLNRGNRDELPGTVLSWLGARLP